MKFRIIVTKIEEKQVEKAIWVPAQGPDDKAGYAPHLVKETVEEEIYSQTVDALDLAALVCEVNEVG